ncbi:MAG: LysR family transcriptional regulator [Gammaproteobacteria bacterium]|nr:LysR family transcriptional regulator [Gammaproteobacteria bacterium]
MEYKNLPDLKGLATLKAVVELGGVEEAGQALHVGQPAVTKRLRALESCYGLALMQREGRRLELTPAGEQVYSYARLVLDHQRSLIDDLETLQIGQSRLRLEVTFAIGEHLLPDLLFSFSETHPEYKIESRMGYTRRIQTRLATGLADLALLEQAPHHPNILVQNWLEDELILVCGPGHHLWQSATIPVAEFQYLKFVLRESLSSMRRVLDAALAEKGIDHIPIAMEVGSTDTIVEMLQRGKHVSILPRFAVAEELSVGGLFHVRVEDLCIKQKLWIARSKSSSNSPVTDAFIKLLSSMSDA